MSSQETPPEAPDRETMDQIRRRRLLRLGGPPPNPSITASLPITDVNPPPSSPTTPIPVDMDKDTNPTGESKPSAASEPVEPGTVATRRSTRVKKRPNYLIDDASESSALRAPPARRQKTRTAPQSHEEWVDATISHIFHVTVDETKGSDGNGHALRFIPELSNDLSGEDGKPTKLTMGVLDPLIVEATSMTPADHSLLTYLYPCFKRAVRSYDTLRSNEPKKLGVVGEIKRLCVANILFAVILPELFGRQERSNPDILALMLVNEVDPEDELARHLQYLHEFFQIVVPRIDEEEHFLSALVNAMPHVSRLLYGRTLHDDYHPHMEVFKLYTKFPPLLEAVAQLKEFRGDQIAARYIEQLTILGPFFRLSTLQSQVYRRDFPTPRSMEPMRLKIAQDSGRMQLRALQNDLHAIVMAFMRVGPETKNRALDWFAHVVNSNHRRLAMRTSPGEVCSDGFMVNITCVLDRLCEPFMNNTFERVDRISLDYLADYQKPRLDITEETKFHAELALSRVHYREVKPPVDRDHPGKVPDRPHFISEVFFLTLAAHHYGIDTLAAGLKTLTRDIEWMEKQLTEMEAEKPNVVDTPRFPEFQAAMARQIESLELAVARKYAMESVLMDEDIQSLALRFMRYVAVWLVRVASETEYLPDQPGQIIPMPLPASGRMEFSCLPEYALTVVVDNFKFIFRFLPQVLVQATGDEFITLCIILLESDGYIKNPHLKASLVTMLYYGTLDMRHRKGLMVGQLLSLKFANDHLLHALMKFYIECESTGRHNQFFDKLNIRYEIFQVIKVIWANDIYKERLTRESEHNTGFFVRFVNLLLNDATFVLDEALSKFPRIQLIEDELSPEKGGNDLSDQDRATKEEELSTLQGQATSYMQLANEYLAMMKLFTKALVSAFTMPEIVSRLAGMLNYNLDTLASEKATHLKVANMGQYKFRPLVLVAEFVEIYLNLKPSSLFVEAVAADGRSYKSATLQRAGDILTARNLLSPADRHRWDVLKAECAKAKALLDQAEQDYGDEIPPEFEDSIMGVIMSDPVILPSKNVIDRSTIMQHLLSDPMDPFTRKPMTIDDVVPATELRDRIEKWKAEKIAQARAKFSGEDAAGDGGDSGDGGDGGNGSGGSGDDGEHMDTTER